MIVTQTNSTQHVLKVKLFTGTDIWGEKKNSVALVRERTIPTERPPPVGEVSANILRIEGCHVVIATDPHGR